MLAGRLRSLNERDGPEWIVRIGESEGSGEGILGNSMTELEMRVKGLYGEVRKKFRQIRGELVS